VLLGGVEGAEVHGRASEPYLPAVAARGMDAGEHLHERALARPVLAAKSVDLARAKVERHAVEGADAGEVLGDGAKLEDYFGHWSLGTSL